MLLAIDLNFQTLKWWKQNVFKWNANVTTSNYKNKSHTLIEIVQFIRIDSQLSSQLPSSIRNSQISPTYRVKKVQIYFLFCCRKPLNRFRLVLIPMVFVIKYVTNHTFKSRLIYFYIAYDDWQIIYKSRKYVTMKL